MMAKALRVLHDLRIAGPVDFPDSGVPQDTRLAFKALSLAADISVSALIHPDFPTSKLQKMVRTAPLAAASMLLNGYGLSHGGISRRRQWYRKLWAWQKALLFEPAAMPLGQVSPLLADSVWRRYLERSLHADDRHLLDEAEILISAVSEDALNGRGSNRSRRIATDGYDFIVFPDVRSARVSAGTKKVVRYHDALPVLAPDFFAAGIPAQHHRLLKRCVDDCYFVCNSEPTRQNLISLFPAVEARTAVVPCALADPTYRADIGVNEIVLQNLVTKGTRPRQRPPSQILPDESFILMVSTIEPRKNHLAAIGAFEILRSTLPKAPKLVIVGKPGFGSEKVLAAMQPGIHNGSIIHLSGVPRAQLNVLYAEAAALIFPSLDEGFGYTPLEAMSNGTPVVASDIRTHRWVLADSVLYAPASDMRALASQIELLVASPGRERLAAELLERARPVLDRYSAQRVSEQWSEVLHRFQALDASASAG
jgi:glycosyltransferase involved in cell wall biosynthesis